MMLLVSQQTTEEHLDRRLTELGGMVHRCYKFITFSPDFPGVTVAVAAPDGSVRAVYARYLIGADGVHSRVRSTAGIGFPGSAREQLFALADVRLEPGSVPAPLEDTTFFFSAEGMLLTSVLADGSTEWLPPFLPVRRRPLPKRPRHCWPPAARGKVGRRSSRSSQHPLTTCRSAWPRGSRTVRSSCWGMLRTPTVVTRTRVSAFTGSDLDLLLRAREIGGLVLTGIATSGVVLSTLRQASDLDFGLTVLEDGCLDTDAEVHRVLTEKVFSVQADVRTIDDWITSIK